MYKKGEILNKFGKSLNSSTIENEGLYFDKNLEGHITPQHHVDTLYTYFNFDSIFT